MDDPLQFRCACGHEYAIARECPQCRQRSNPTHFQLADGTWIDSATFHAKALENLTSKDVHITTVGLLGKRKSYTLENCPPRFRKKIITQMKEQLGKSAIIPKFLNEDEPKDQP